jgi:superfamily II DNA or RNA helicase
VSPLAGPSPIRRGQNERCPLSVGFDGHARRSDGREAALDSLIGPIVFRYPLSEAKGRILADYEVKRIPVYLTPDERAKYDRCSGVIRHFMSEQRKTHPNYSFVELRKEYAKSPEARQVLQAFYAKESIEDRAHEKMRVLEDLFRLHQGQRILVFTKTNMMAREVSARFLIPSLLHHCRKRERKDILDGFRTNRYAAIVANQVLDEGVDLPEAKVAVVLGGLASVKQAKQRLGRILRKRGEETAILYEVVCNDTKEVERSRQRRRSDAYQGTRHLRL